VDIEADGDFDHYEEEVEGDADDEGAVDLFEVNGVMVMAKAMGMVVTVVMIVVFVGMIVGMCGCHKGILLSVIVSCRGEGIDDLAVRVGIGGVGDMGGDSMGGAGGEEEFFSADDHFQLSVKDISDLFVGVAVFGQPATFFDFPDGERAFVAVHHFPKKTRPYFFGWDVGEILHERFSGEGKKNWEITERSEGYEQGETRDEVSTKLSVGAG
jgi:hypothetical protein